MNKIFNMPLKTFEPEKLLEEMLSADEGTVFVLGAKRTPNHEGDDTVELTIAQIQKVKDSQTTK